MSSWSDVVRCQFSVSKIEPLKISTKPPVKEYKKSFLATQLARNWEKEQKEQKGKQGKTKG
jgi:hypothetical protein